MQLRGLLTLLNALLIGVVASTVSAQTVPRGQVGVGYQFMTDYELEETFADGFAVSGAAHVGEWFGLAGEFGYSRWTDEQFDVDLGVSLYAIAAGPRVYRRRGRTTPFAQILMGGVRARRSIAAGGTSLFRESDTAFALQPGVGLDVRLTDRIGMQIQGDFRRIFFEGNGHSQFRLTTGVVIWLGRAIGHRGSDGAKRQG